MPQQQQLEPQPVPVQTQQQQQAQQMQDQSLAEPRNHSALIALSIAMLAKQLNDLADLEKDKVKRDAMRAKSAEIIERARDVARLWPDKLYITVPPDWEPPEMLEPCPDCTRMRSKHEKA